MKLNIRQRKVVEAEEPKILCLAAASSGKTRVLTERIKYLIEQKHVAPEGIVAITFTTAAAEEMKARLGDICIGAFIGTVHAYASDICIYNGIDTSVFTKQFEFNKILERARVLTSKQFLPVEHILIDECQDIGPLEYGFLEKIPAKNWFWVGDDRQMIYGFKGSSLEYLENLYKDDNYKKYYLVENYRNAPNILSFAEDFLTSYDPMSPKSVPHKTQKGLIEKCSFDEALDELEINGSWGDWFILTRTNNELAAAQEKLEERGIPNVTFKRGDLELIELEEIMNSNRVKVLTIHTSKGLEAPNVIVAGARLYCEEERKIAYVAATRAQSMLYWCPSIAKRYKKGTGMNRKAEAGRITEKTAQEMVYF
jgi:superfamily I DNA/RNA helicase